MFWIQHRPVLFLYCATNYSKNCRSNFNMNKQKTTKFAWNIEKKNEVAEHTSTQNEICLIHKRIKCLPELLLANKCFVFLFVWYCVWNCIGWGIFGGYNLAHSSEIISLRQTICMPCMWCFWCERLHCFTFCILHTILYLYLCLIGILVFDFAIILE